MSEMRGTDRAARCWMVATLLCGLFVMPPGSRARVQPPPPIESEVLEQFHNLRDPATQAGWKRESANIEHAIDNLWRRNGWTNPSDEFARKLLRDVATIPPWQPIDRLNAFHHRLAERYGLSDSSARLFQSLTLQETGRLLARNGGTILGQLREVLETRGRGRPFTADQVARWSKQSPKIMKDVRASVERITRELEPLLDAAHEQVLRHDLRSYAKRERYIEAMTARWAEGKWRPADWGLEDDPLQANGAESVPPVPARRPVVRTSPKRADRPKQPLRWSPDDPSTWSAYVVAFGRRFGLDASQTSTAESIHTELYDRAADYSESHAAALAKVASRDRHTHPLFEPIRQLFEELQTRLDAIPTSGQRQRANAK